MNKKSYYNYLILANTFLLCLLSKNSFGMLIKKHKALNHLPTEILYEVYDYLGHNYLDIHNVSKVSKHTYKSLLYFLKTKNRITLTLDQNLPDISCDCLNLYDTLHCIKFCKLPQKLEAYKKSLENVEVAKNIFYDKTLSNWLQKKNKTISYFFRLATPENYPDVLPLSTVINSSVLKDELDWLKDLSKTYKHEINIYKKLVRIDNVEKYFSYGAKVTAVAAIILVVAIIIKKTR